MHCPAEADVRHGGSARNVTNPVRSGAVRYGGGTCEFLPGGGLQRRARGTRRNLLLCITSRRHQAFLDNRDDGHQKSCARPVLPAIWALPRVENKRKRHPAPRRSVALASSPCRAEIIFFDRQPSWLAAPIAGRNSCACYSQCVGTPRKNNQYGVT